MIHLRGPQGMVIDLSLPLHETITEQWRNGELERVTADGSPWEGDPFDLSTADDAAPSEASEPETDQDADGGQGAGEGGGADGGGQEPEQPAGGGAEAG